MSEFAPGEGFIAGCTVCPATHVLHEGRAAFDEGRHGVLAIIMRAMDHADRVGQPGGYDSELSDYGLPPSDYVGTSPIMVDYPRFGQAYGGCTLTPGEILAAVTACYELHCDGSGQPESA